MSPLHLNMRPFRGTSLLLLLLLLCCGDLAAQTTCAASKRGGHPRTRTKSGNGSPAPIDILHQRITLDLTLGNLIRGACTITAVPRANELESFDLNLEGLTTDSVTGAGVNWSHAQNGIMLTLTPDVALNTTDTVEFTVFYGGDPVTDPSGFGGFYTNPSLIYNLGVAFESVPHSYGRTWFPCLDDFVERSTYEFLIRTAGGRKAWCNGALVERLPLGGDTLINHWACQESMPAYLVSVAAANYTVARDTLPTILGGTMPVELIGPAADTADMRASFAHLADAFAHFEDRFGPYRWEKVGYVLTPVGAMEHSTSIHYPSSIADGSLTYETTMAHELAHHWFGNLVTCDRAEEMYLNEGFAEYLSYLFLEQVYGRSRYMSEVRSNHRSMVQRAHLVDEGWWALGDMPQTWTYGTTTYNKGADVLHSLRSYMGDQAFFEGLSNFLGTHAFEPVNTVTLREHLSMTSGMDLTPFFTDWILQPGWAAFEIDAQTVTPAGEDWIVQLDLGQKLFGPAVPYTEVPITVAVVGTDTTNVLRDTMLVGGWSTEVSLSVPFEPAFIWLNDDDRLSLGFTGSTHMVTNTVAINSTPANFELRPRPGPATLMRMEQYWVAADEGSFAEPFAYVISPDRYWRFTGDWTDPQRFGGRLFYDGRNTLNTLDPGLLRDTLGVSFHEDSLVLLHRSGADAPWVKWSDQVFTLGSPTDGYGRMDLDSLATGEYVLAWRTSPVGLRERTSTAQWSVGPNPATTSINVRRDMANGAGTIRIQDGRGRTVHAAALQGRELTISAEGLAAGRYSLVFSDGLGPEIHIGHVVIGR